MSGEYKLEKPIEELVLYEEVEDHIVKLILNRPEKHNALFMPHSFLELARKLERAYDDDNVKVIILCANGKSFCTGDDLNISPYESFGGAPGTKPPQSVRIRGAQKNLGIAYKLLMEAPKIVISSVRGWCIGGGVELTAFCDLTIASETAKFGQHEQRIGFAGWEPYTHMITLLEVGPKRYREWLLTGKTLSAQEALDWGLVNSVVPDDKLEEETLRWAQAIAMQSTDGLMIGKAMTRLCYDLLGNNAIFTATQVFHPLFTNLKWRDDELNFLRSRDQEGTTQSFKSREQRWADLGF